MGSTISNVTNDSILSLKQLFTTKKQVVKAKAQVKPVRSKQLESFNLDTELVKKPRKSIVNLEYRPNGTTIYVQPSSTTASKKQKKQQSRRRLRVDSFDPGVIIESTNYDSSDTLTSSTINSSQFWKSSDNLLLYEEITPKSVIKTSSIYLNRLKSPTGSIDIVENEQYRQSFAYALKRIESRRSNVSSTMRSRATSYDEVSPYNIPNTTTDRDYYSPEHFKKSLKKRVPHMVENGDQQPITNQRVAYIETGIRCL